MSSNNGLKVPFGLKAGALVEPHTLPSGKDSECLCPGCRDILVVRKGSKRAHFAHFRKVPTENCVETALHQAAKQILMQEQRMMIPQCRV